MTDFLTRLVSRTLSPTEGVRPQIAPLFASVARPSVEVQFGDVAAHPTPVEQRVQDDAPPAQNPESPVKVTKATARESKSGRLEKQDSAEQPLPATDFQVSATQPSSLVQNVEPPPPAAGQLAGYSPATLREIETQPAPAGAASFSVDLYQPLVPGFSPWASNAGLQSQARSAHAAAPFPGNYQARDYRQVGDGTREAAGRDTSPTIKVTIGRVEVRAVLPPAPAPPPAPRPAPKLTLDEYIKQRNQGLR